MNVGAHHWHCLAREEGARHWHAMQGRRAHVIGVPLQGREGACHWRSLARERGRTLLSVPHKGEMANVTGVALLGKGSRLSLARRWRCHVRRRISWAPPYTGSTFLVASWTGIYHCICSHDKAFVVYTRLLVNLMESLTERLRTIRMAKQTGGRTRQC